MHDYGIILVLLILPELLGEILLYCSYYWNYRDESFYIVYMFILPNY